jgi:hypothetical protein
MKNIGAQLASHIDSKTYSSLIHNKLKNHSSSIIWVHIWNAIRSPIDNEISLRICAEIFHRIRKDIDL